MSETIENNISETATAPKETFSREYVQELRAENKDWRLKYQEMHNQLEQLQRDSTEHTIKLEQETKTRLIQAELKALAIKAGMVDIDGLKLADLSKVTLTDDGQLGGADVLLTNLKANKPYLFQESTSSSHASPPPSPKPPEIKKATEMTAAEYTKARAALLKASR